MVVVGYNEALFTPRVYSVTGKKHMHRKNKKFGVWFSLVSLHNNFK